MAGRVLLIATCLVGGACAFFWPFSNDKEPTWNGLRVTFNMPWKSNAFAKMPRTVREARDAGWDSLTSTCDPKGQFLGQRFILNGDRAVILLFDVQGYIAGIQTSFNANLSESYPPLQQRGVIFQQETEGQETFFTLTAYFTDPAVICNGGRSEEDFKETGTGTELFLQIGPDPVKHNVSIPYYEKDVEEKHFTKGSCFPLMGLHYWYNISEDMSCDNFQPVFLLYTDGKLDAFGWAMGIGLTSPRYEHPKHDQISKFMKPVPRCLYDYPVLSTMHIYLTSSYWRLCPIF